MFFSATLSITVNEISPVVFKFMWYGGKKRIKCPYQPTHQQYGVCDTVTGTSVDQNKFRIQGSKSDCRTVTDVCDTVTGTAVDQNKFRVQGSKSVCPAMPVTTACLIF